MATRHATQRGSVSFQVLVLMVPVFFGLIGFAVDLGRLYSARNDLKLAANAMAEAAAARLNSTDNAFNDAALAGNYAIDATVTGGKYDFSGLVVGQTTGNFNSEAPTLNYFDNLASALGTEGASGSEAGATTAKYVKVTVRGEAPLIFWRFLTLGVDGKVNLATQATAGVSSPLCTACGIENLGVQAISQDDTTDFGFAIGSRYTLGYLCNGAPTPANLPNTTARVPYVILNKYNEGATVLSDEQTQLYRIGSLGLPTGVDPTYSCLNVSNPEDIWANASPLACNQNRVNSTITTVLCGLAARFDNTTTPAVCTSIPESDSILAASSQDTDLNDLDDYTAYTGNGRRIITVPIIDTATTATMTILGYRQFLIEPAAGDITINAADANGRFGAMYLGTVKPVRAGRFSGCSLTSGPGKVVLHQ